MARVVLLVLVSLLVVAGCSQPSSVALTRLQKLHRDEPRKALNVSTALGEPLDDLIRRTLLEEGGC